MTTVTIHIDGMTVSVSHPVAEPTLDQTLCLIEHALRGHGYLQSQLDAALNHDDMALVAAEVNT